MAKQKKQPRSAALFSTLEKMTSPPENSADAENEVLDLTSLADQAIRVVPDSSRTLRMKKFRAQLLHVWLETNFQPCRAADIGGGKGLLGHLLERSGWEVTVIDPVGQPLPDKYKDIRTDQRVKVLSDEAVARIDTGFQVEMGAGFRPAHRHACPRLQRKDHRRGGVAWLRVCPLPLLRHRRAFLPPSGGALAGMPGGLCP